MTQARPKSVAEVKALLKAAAEGGSLSHPEKFRADLEKIQSRLQGRLPEPVVLAPSTLEERVAALEKLVAALQQKQES